MNFKVGDRVMLRHDIPISDGRSLVRGVPCEISIVYNPIIGEIANRYQIVYDSEIIVTVLSHEIELDKGYYRDITLNKLGI